VEIQDNGSGIPKDVLAKIFDPFFTTKPVGKGTGLGLSISYKIVQEHGGRIDIATEVGVGTVFAIVLPTSAVERPAVHQPQEEEELVAA
jgi:signal transduction histidine kinase